MKKSIRNHAASLVLSLLGSAALAQYGPPVGDIAFKAQGLERKDYPSISCTGFWRTPTWKCVKISLPTYFVEATNGDTKAIVVVSPGAGGLDKRHSDYAHHLAANGMNAIVLDHWTARGMVNADSDYEKARSKGGSEQNYAIDILTLVAQLKLQPKWENSKVGYLGESMGGGAAIHITRPYIATIVKENSGLDASAVRDVDASVSLYPSCTDRIDIERFKKIPLLLMAGGKDEVTPAWHCERFVPWMNSRGGSATFLLLPDEGHDWDSLRPLRMSRWENVGNCANIRIGKKFILESTGKEYPDTSEGYGEMLKACRTRGHSTGHRGNPQTGYGIWTAFLKKQLLDE